MHVFFLFLRKAHGIPWTFSYSMLLFAVIFSTVKHNMFVYLTNDFLNLNFSL